MTDATPSTVPDTLDVESEPGAPPTTRDRILEAAMDLFASEGYRGTAISEIERRVGLAPGTGSLYHHFPSKAALLREAVRREVELRRAEMAAARDDLPPTEDSDEWRALRYEQMLRDVRRFDRLFRLMLNEGDRVPELREAIWEALRHPTQWPTGGEHAVDAVAQAALGGYHLFSLMQGESYNGISQKEFIGTLVALTSRR